MSYSLDSAIKTVMKRAEERRAYLLICYLRFASEGKPSQAELISESKLFLYCHEMRAARNHYEMIIARHKRCFVLIARVARLSPTK